MVCLSDVAQQASTYCCCPPAPTPERNGLGTLLTRLAKEGSVVHGILLTLDVDIVFLGLLESQQAQK